MPYTINVMSKKPVIIMNYLCAPILKNKFTMLHKLNEWREMFCLSIAISKNKRSLGNNYY